MAYLAFQPACGVPSELPSGFFSALAAHLTDALSVPTGESVRALESELSKVIGRVLKGAAKDAAAVAQGQILAGAVADAYALGQLSFAQQLASQAANASIDQEFLDTLKSGKFIPYLRALYDGEHSNKQLKDIVCQSEENVSRRLKELRDLGVTDFRKDGTLVYNFLTPVARQIISAERKAADEFHRAELGDLQPGVGAILEGLFSESPDFMRTAATFDSVSHE